MRDFTWVMLFLGKEKNFIERYKDLRDNRFFLADSAADFVNNKDSLNTPISDLLFFSDPNTKTIIFHDVKLEKYSDEIYEFGENGEGYLAKQYRVYEETKEFGEFLSYWPTENSKFYHNLSCERFEQIKNFKGNLIKSAAIVYHRKTKHSVLGHIEFYDSRKRKEKTKLEELSLVFPNPL